MILSKAVIEDKTKEEEVSKFKSSSKLSTRLLKSAIYEKKAVNLR